LSHHITAAPSIRNIKINTKILNTSPLHRSHLGTSPARIIGMPHASKTIAMTKSQFRRQNWSPDQRSPVGSTLHRMAYPPCHAGRPALYGTLPWAQITARFQRFSTIFNLFKPGNLFSHPTEKLFDILKHSETARAGNRRLGGTGEPASPEADGRR
jgi:hypothetical protein